MSAEAQVEESDDESLGDIDPEASVTFGFSVQDQEDFRLGQPHRPRNSSERGLKSHLVNPTPTYIRKSHKLELATCPT